MNEPASEIRQAIQSCNRSWTGGNPRGVAALFHEDVVMVSPGGAPLARGRAEMVRSFVAYCEHVRTHAFRAADPHIHVVGNSAVASYGFGITYEVDGRRFEEQGREVLVFTYENDRWQIVWRMQMPAEAGNDAGAGAR